jgi:hypothetical protein
MNFQSFIVHSHPVKLNLRQKIKESRMPLYTFIMDYDGGTYISLVAALVRLGGTLKKA